MCLNCCPRKSRKGWRSAGGSLRPTACRFTYAFLHRAIIERFIVRAGRLGADEKPEIWKDGIVIYDDTTDTEALVEAFPREKCIRIQAREAGSPRYVVYDPQGIRGAAPGLPSPVVFLCG